MLRPLLENKWGYFFTDTLSPTQEINIRTGGYSTLLLAGYNWRSAIPPGIATKGMMSVSASSSLQERMDELNSLGQVILSNGDTRPQGWIVDPLSDEQTDNLKKFRLLVLDPWLSLWPTLGNSPARVYWDNTQEYDWGQGVLAVPEVVASALYHTHEMSADISRSGNLAARLNAGLSMDVSLSWQLTDLSSPNIESLEDSIEYGGLSALFAAFHYVRAIFLTYARAGRSDVLFGIMNRNPGSRDQDLEAKLALFFPKHALSSDALNRFGDWVYPTAAELANLPVDEEIIRTPYVEVSSIDLFPLYGQFLSDEELRYGALLDNGTRLSLEKYATGVTSYSALLEDVTFGKLKSSLPAFAYHTVEYKRGGGPISTFARVSMVNFDSPFDSDLLTIASEMNDVPFCFNLDGVSLRDFIETDLAGELRDLSSVVSSNKDLIAHGAIGWQRIEKDSLNELIATGIFCQQFLTNLNSAIEADPNYGDKRLLGRLGVLKHYETPYGYLTNSILRPNSPVPSRVLTMFSDPLSPIVPDDYLVDEEEVLSTDDPHNFLPFYLEYVRSYGTTKSNQNRPPLSILLGQAYLESSCGRSRLARRSNNCFGIKADKYWLSRNRPYVTAADDIPNDKFRKYDKVADSMEDYIEFLSSNRRYKSCPWGSDDYIAWAYALKRAGYATAANYPRALIGQIESKVIPFMKSMSADPTSLVAQMKVTQITQEATTDTQKEVEAEQIVSQNTSLVVSSSRRSRQNPLTQ